ncbi:MAG: glycosyltransferase family 2 protein [Thermoguttaceae bacterium]
MKISVALATYNGAEFLAEQLQSLVAQRRLPDELVVCDDASTDQTAAILRRFAEACPFEVRIEINPQTLGSAANFARAVALCRGEVIALADQDDLWLPEKLGTIERAMADEPRLGMVFSDARLIDASGRRLSQRLWQAIGFDGPLQRRFAGRAAQVLVKRNVVTGATMAFRAAHRDLLLPVAGHWFHDGWFALLLAAVAPCRAIAEPLMEYRQHAEQQIGALKGSLPRRLDRAIQEGQQRLETAAADYDLAGQRLAAFRTRLTDERLLTWLTEKAEHLRTRAQIRQSLVGRLPRIVGELVHGRYAKYSENGRAILQDLLL